MREVVRFESKPTAGSQFGIARPAYAIRQESDMNMRN